MFKLKFFPPLLLALIFACGVSVSYTQEIGFRYKKLGMEEGLPSTEVYESLQDSKGYMWFCTDAGVSRFDGYFFENFDTQDGLTDNTVFHLYEDHKGRVWFLSLNSQLCYFENDSIHTYKHIDLIESVITSGWIRSIYIDREETLHFVGNRFGYGTISAKGELNYQNKTNQLNKQIAYIKVEEELLIFGLEYSKDRVETRLFEQQYNYLEIPNQLNSAPLYRYVLPHDEVLLNVGGVAGHYKFDGQIYRSLSWIAHDSIVIHNIHRDEQGRIWVAENYNGLKVYDHPADMFNGNGCRKHLLKGRNISGITSDRAGGVWLSIQNDGVYYISNAQIDIHTLSSNEVTNRISALALGNDRIYAGTYDGGIFELNERTVPKRLTQTNFSDHARVLPITFKDLQGKPYFESNRKRIRTSNKTVWEVNNLRISKLVNGKVSGYNFSEHLNCIFEGADGKIYASSNSGLFQYSDDQFIRLNQYELFMNRIDDIDQLKDGTILLASRGIGLLFWKGEELIQFDERDGLSTNIISDIHIDGDENIWLSTPNGINRLIMNGEGVYLAQHITDVNGLPSREVNSIVSQGLMIWAATNKGVVRFNKNEIKKNTTIPALHFEFIKINEEHVELNVEYETTYERNNVEIGFIGLCYPSNGNVLYRYRMKGVEKKWVYSRVTSVRYPSLAAGEYVFEVQVANEDGKWGGTQSISIIVTPPFWKTIWFSLISVASFFIMILVLLRWREKKQQEKREQEALLEKQKLLTVQSELMGLRAQMNPHFTFNTLSAIQSTLHNSPAEVTSKYIGDYSRLIRKILENSKRMYLPLEEEVEMLRLYIEVEQLRFAGRFTYEIKIDENLDLSFHEIPSMMIQPFVENAILHGFSALKGSSGKLIIQLSLVGEVIHCSVEDNGIGRAESRKIQERKGLNHESMALDITENRMNIYQKEFAKEYTLEIIDLFTVNNSPAGTKVLLTFPI